MTYKDVSDTHSSLTAGLERSQDANNNPVKSDLTHGTCGLSNDNNKLGPFKQLIHGLPMVKASLN
jgi:hypothetical protein